MKYQEIIVSFVATCMILSCSDNSNLTEQLSGNEFSVTVRTNTDVTARTVIDGSYLPDKSMIGVTVIDEVSLAEYEGVDFNNVKFTADGTGNSQVWAGEKELHLIDYKAMAIAYYPYSSSTADYTAIPVTTGLTDYMYSGWVTGLNNENPNAVFPMKHALTALEFNIRKQNYDGDGVISGLKFKSPAVALSATLNAETGVLSAITGLNEWYPATVSGTIDESGVKFERVAVPDISKTDKTLDVVLTVDGVDYTKFVVLDNPVSQGSKISMNFVLTRNDLQLQNVNVTPWVVHEHEETGLDTYNSYLTLVYNVTSTTSNTQLLYNNTYYTGEIAEMYIDGVSVTPAIHYKFSSLGKHEVKIKFKDETIIPTYNNTGAFLGCTNLTNILSFPTQLESIGSGAFSNTNIVSCPAFPPKLKTIGDNAFNQCKKMITKLVLPNSLTSIGSYAFNKCSGIRESLLIPQGVTTIGAGAFAECTGITGELIIPNSVTSLGGSAFFNCSQIESVVLSENVLKLNDGSYYLSANWPDKLESSTFGNCTRLSSIKLPSRLQYIGNYTFCGCSNLTNIEIPNTVTYIGKGAFANCNELKRVILPDNVTELPDCYYYDGSYAPGVFQGCSKLEYIFINKNLNYISSRGTFFYCNSLKEIVVDEENVVFDSRNDCNAIINTQTNQLLFGCNNTVIPENVTSIGNYAFYYRTGITGELVIPESVTSIGQYAFYNCSGLSNITIPNSVTSIGVGAFQYCTGLTEMTIPESVTSIGLGTFYGCTGLTTVDLGTGLQTIGQQMFYNCTGLTEVTIPNSVSNIGQSAFYGCTGLTDIISLATTAPTIYSNTFYHVKSGGTLTIPAGATGYDAWMSKASYYLGYYSWALIESDHSE